MSSTPPDPRREAAGPYPGSGPTGPSGDARHPADPSLGDPLSGGVPFPDSAGYPGAAPSSVDVGSAPATVPGAPAGSWPAPTSAAWSDPRATQWSAPRHSLPEHGWSPPADPSAARPAGGWSAEPTWAGPPPAGGIVPSTGATAWGPPITGPDAAPVWGRRDPARPRPAGWRRAAGAVAVAAAVAVVGGAAVATAGTTGATTTDRFGPGMGGFTREGGTQGVPGEGGASGTVPDGTVPEGTVPDGTVPDGTLPEGFDPSQIPEGFDPSRIPEGFDPSQIPDGFDPSQIPDGMMPGQLPDGVLPEQGGTDGAASADQSTGADI